jgi:cytochrome c5
MRPNAIRGAVACLLLGLSVAVLACGERPPTEEAMQPPPTGDDLILASTKIALPPPGIAPSELPEAASEGARLLRQYCTACHALPSPQTHSATDWPVVLRRMWLRTEGVADQFDVPVPTSAERVILLDYVLANALQVSGRDLPAGPGRSLYQNTCARCHELPDPGQHSGNDWPAVVMRMRQHMVQMLQYSPSQSDVQEIILYLERASG